MALGLMPILAFAESLSAGSFAFLLVALGLALAFEFVNGFHDTANAVATVIYTHSLPPWVAVIWSGLCNLTGVLISSGAVAYSIVALLPVELVINVGSGAGFAMIFSLLISAILWNLGTWYLGLPASSSHTLIGSILGVGLANAVMAGHGMAAGLNWAQVRAVFTTLLVSPIVGFVAAGLLLLLLKWIVRQPALFRPPPKDQPPPWWIRGTLMLTCTGVSLAHGSNDGQKGMGLLLLILIGVLPAEFALNMRAKPEDLRRLEAAAVRVQPMLDAHAGATGADPSAGSSGQSGKGTIVTSAISEKVGAGKSDPVQQPSETAGRNAAELSQYLENGGTLSGNTFAAVAAANRDLIQTLQGTQSFAEVPPARRKTLRTDLYLVNQTLAKLAKTHQIQNPEERRAFEEYDKLLDKTTKYLPLWVKIAVAIALGFGTMIGWKRIVLTVGEKIGKEHLNYAQGASAELVAMATIGAADWYGMPVSTTHVLSSGVAGTMAANRSGLQMATLRNVLMAWILTLPVCVLLGAATFAAGLYIVFKQLVPQAAAVTLVFVLLLVAWRMWSWMRDRSRRPAMAASEAA
ncbi:MAG TPA: inorganic phosphate transporter [Tepidisphaeraceae bacterium]